MSAIGSAVAPNPTYAAPSAASAPASGSTTATVGGQVRSDFMTLFAAVQQGDMSTAQQALASVQSDLGAGSGTYSPQSTSGTSSLPSDLQSLMTAVQQGDAAGAQQALTQLQSDAQTQAQAPMQAQGHHHHHHHHASGAGNDASSGAQPANGIDATTTSDGAGTATDDGSAAGFFAN